MGSACLLQFAPFHLRYALEEAALAAAGETMRPEVSLGALGHYLPLFDQPVAGLRVWLGLLRELEG